MSTRYQLEGRDQDGQWDWSHVSADGIEANTMFDTEEEAESAQLELVRIYGCPDDEIRVVAIDPDPDPDQVPADPPRITDDGERFSLGLEPIDDTTTPAKRARAIAEALWEGNDPVLLDALKNQCAMGRSSIPQVRREALFFSPAPGGYAQNEGRALHLEGAAFLHPGESERSTWSKSGRGGFRRVFGRLTRS